MSELLTITANGQLNPDEFALEFKTQFGSAVKYYDDGFGPLWIMRDTMGIVGIVRAQSFEDAYGIVEDEFLPVVPRDELHEAYGSFDRLVERMEKRGHANDMHLRQFANEWAPFWFDSEAQAGVELELIEGYSYQSNSTGTGVVPHDMNGQALDALTLELAERLELQIVVKMSK